MKNNNAKKQEMRLEFLTDAEFSDFYKTLNALTKIEGKIDETFLEMLRREIDSYIKLNQVRANLIKAKSELNELISEQFDELTKDGFEMF